VQLRHAPTWHVSFDVSQDPSAKYELEVFDEFRGSTHALVSYTGRALDVTHLAFPWFGPQMDIEPGHRYLFILVRNGMLSQLPL